MDSATVAHAIGLQPSAAIEHLAGKDAAVTGSWREWLDGEHARGFTVANVAKLDVVADIQASLVEALKKGQTLEQWKKDLVPTLQRKGWWQREGTTAQLQAAGRVDQATGEISKGLVPARLKTIYQTNMQSAYMAGRFDTMMAQVDERPFWERVAVMDARTRPSHAAMNGLIFRYDDPFCQTVWAPCGYNCRCRMRGLSARDMERGSKTVTSSAGKLSQVEVPLKGGGVATVTRYTDPALKARGAPNGYFQPDPGFSNNPAKSVWMPRLEDKPRDLSRPFVREAVAGPQFEQFVNAKGQLQGEFPVAVLTEDAQAALKVKPSTVYLSNQTLAKQAERHPEIGLDDYRQVPDIVDFGEVYEQTWWAKSDADAGANRLAYLYDGDVVYRLALKATDDKNELYLLSLFKTTAASAQREVRDSKRFKKLR